MQTTTRFIFFFLLFLYTGFAFAQTALSKLSVEGNKFVTESGETLVFRGLNTSDPDKLEKDGHWNRAYFEEMRNWGANIVRFPVHPRAWQARGKEEYIKKST